MDDVITYFKDKKGHREGRAVGRISENGVTVYYCFCDKRYDKYDPNFLLQAWDKDFNKIPFRHQEQFFNFVVRCENRFSRLFSGRQGEQPKQEVDAEVKQHDDKILLHSAATTSSPLSGFIVPGTITHVLRTASGDSINVYVCGSDKPIEMHSSVEEFKTLYDLVMKK